MLLMMMIVMKNLQKIKGKYFVLFGKIVFYFIIHCAQQFMNLIQKQ